MMRTTVLVVFAAWQLILGWRILSFSSWYGKSNLPQAQRVAELLGVSWVLFGLLTGTAAWSSDETLLTKAVLWAAILSSSCFSLAAGPFRLTPANPREKIIVPVNTLIAAWAAVSMMV